MNRPLSIVLMKRLFVLLFSCLFAFCAMAQTSGFMSSEIPDSVFARMKGKSFATNCTVARSSLCYLRVKHWGKDQHPHDGELICNKRIAQDLLEIFEELYKAHYPIERIALVDNYGADDERSMAANNTSCFNFRTIAGTNRISKHGQGMAIDLNPLYNPCVKKNGNVAPKSGKAYAHRRDSRQDIPMKIDRHDLAYKLFVAHGFRWGGAWPSTKDYQHFEK